MKRLAKTTIHLNLSRFALFGPGLCLVLLGIVAVVAPRLVIAVISTFFIFVGLLLVYLAYRVMEFRKKAEKVIKEFSSRVSVQAFGVQGGANHGLGNAASGNTTEIFTEEDIRSPRMPGDKKVTWH